MKLQGNCNTLLWCRSLQVVIRDILLGSPPECNGLLCEAFGPAANIDARLLIIAVAVLACAPLLLMRWAQQAV